MAVSLVVVAGAGPVAAQTNCDAVVVDTGRVDADAIEAHIAGLPDDATWVVRAYDSVPSGLEIEMLADIAECFADGPGDRQIDLVMIGVSIDDRDAFTYYGDEFVAVLDPIFDIGAAPDAMGDEFRADDYTQGLINGLDLAASAIAPGVVTPPTSSTGEDDGSDLGGIILIGGVAVFGAGIAGAGAVGRRRKLQAKRSALEARAAEPRTRVGVSREKAARLTDQADLWERTVSGRSLESLREHRASVRAGSNDMERSAALFTQAVPKGIAKASDDELELGGQRLEELTDSIGRLNDSIERLTVLGERFDRLRITLPTKVALLAEELSDADQLADERRAEGFVVDGPVAIVAENRTRLGSIDLQPLTLDLLALSDEVEAIEAELFSARHDLQSLPDRIPALEAWSDRLVEAAELERRRVASGRESFGAAAAIHAEQSWAWAADHPATAKEWIDRAEALRAKAMAEVMVDQDWRRAGSTLEAAGLDLLKADEVLDDVDTLMVNLKTAREQAVAILAEADRELGELRAFVHRHDDDLPARFDLEPNDVEEAIAALAAELQRDRPNYLLVAQTGTRLDHQIDALLVEAAEEHQRVEALRREAQRQVERALRAVERAESSVGWQLIKTREGRDLDQLKTELQQLPSELEARIDAASGIADEATSIRERIIHARRRNNTWVVIGGTSGGWGGGGGGGSSSSSGGGGFGGFSGGGGGGGFGGFSGGGGFGGGGGGGSW